MSGQATSYGNQPFGEIGLTAMGTNQATALMLPSQINIFTNVPPGTGCRSPAIPSTLTVINDDPTNTLLWYPPSGDEISGNKPSVPISVPAGQQMTMAWFGSALDSAPRVWQLINNGFGLNLSVPGTVTTGSMAIGGAQQDNNLLTVRGESYQIASKADPTTDFFFNTQNNTVTYSANAVGGDSVGLAGEIGVAANGNTVSVPQHITGLYGIGYLANDGNAAGVVTWINGGVFSSGNQGPGTVTNAVDIRGHADINTSGGTLTNHYFLYQEPSSGATNEYGGYLSGPLGIGNNTPSYNLDINSANTGGLNTTNWLRAGSGNGTLLVTSNGTTIFPGFSVGAGSFGASDICVGVGSGQNATTATASFLFIGSSAGAPTGVPAHAASGRVAMQVDTTNNKLWLYINGAWKGVVVS